MHFTDILYEVRENICKITLNRPERLNAYTIRMKDELLEAFSLADEDDQVRAVIVTGAGRAFCAGMELEAEGHLFGFQEKGTKKPDIGNIRDSGGEVTLKIFSLKKPVIAAVNGPAVGVGATMILAMDVRLASEKARIGFVFSQRGLVPEACSSWFLPRVVGISQALEWIYTGSIFGPEEALEGGLVKSIHAPEDLMAEAEALAGKFANKTSPISVAMARQMLWRMMGASHPMEAHKVDSRAIYACHELLDGKEGIASFLEKRDARFTSKVSKDMPWFYPWWEDPPLE